MTQVGNRNLPDVVLSDVAGNPLDPTAALPQGATQVNAASGDVPNGVAAATLPAVVGKTNYLTGFEITGSGATAGLPVAVTVTGILGGTLTYIYNFAAGVLVGNQPLAMQFFPPLQASAANVAIVVSCPAGGAANAHNATVAHGYVK